MMSASQLHAVIVKDVLTGSRAQPVGRLYLELSRLYPLQPIKSKQEHALALSLLIKLSDLIQHKAWLTKEKRQILDYMDALGLLVEAYEKKAVSAKINLVDGVDILEFLMEEHGLRQSDLAQELGSQSVVSDLLSRKRTLNTKQIRALSARFGVSPSVFFS